MELRTPNFVPRLASSRQWTALPADLIISLKKIFDDEFKSDARFGDFVIEGRIYGEELIVRAGFLEKGRLKQVNFEASMDLR